MYKVNEKLFSWASISDPQARMQTEALSRLAFIYPHVCEMPDTHFGLGAPVGTVIPTVGAIIPAAVGVDIGCGMMAVRTQFTEAEVKSGILSELRRCIEEAIPSSAGRYNQDYYGQHTKDRIHELEMMPGIAQAEEVTAQRGVTHIKGNSRGWDMQLGSLGGGNHFIEVSADETGQIWLFLHSGSRGVGNKLAQKHIKVAQTLMKLYHVNLENPDLAYIPEDTAQFHDYIEALRWAQMFARLNREEMMHRLMTEFATWMGEWDGAQETIQCHHNYTMREEHFGKMVYLSRKGAIDASLGTPGLIPGSMGEASYVVSGLGNKMSLNSAPHGAGRLFSRGEAKRRFDLSYLEDKMKGIEWSGSEAFLDEAPGAYKPIDQVMEDAAELVEVKHVLHQLVNVKGN